MKIKLLSFLLTISLISSCFVAANVFADYGSLNLSSSVYKVTYNNPLYNNNNTVSDIPLNTKINTFLYNMRKDNPDYIINIFTADNKVPELWEDISEHSSRRMYIIVKKDNSDIGERFVLVSRILSEMTDDFEKYASGIFNSNSYWKFNKTSANAAIGYIICESDGNRLFRTAAPAAGDSDYTATQNTTLTNLETSRLCALEGNKTEIKFRLRNNNSSVFVQLRDANHLSADHHFRVIHNLGTSLVCFSSKNYIKDANGNNLSFNYGEWVNFRIVIDRLDTNKIYVYLNDIKDAVASASLSNYSQFDWNEFKIQFSASATRLNTLRAESDVDDFSYKPIDNTQTALVAQAVNVYSRNAQTGFEYSGAVITGDNKLKLTVSPGKITTPSKLYAAEKSDGELVSLSVIDIPSDASDTKYYPVELNVKNAGKHIVELFLWQEQSLTPLGIALKPQMSTISKAASNGHPRVLANSQSFDNIKSYTHPLHTDWKNKVVSYADEICNGFTTSDKSSSFYIGNEHSFSDVSNRIKSFGACLGVAYQLENDTKYSHKLYEILLASSNHSGWTDGTLSNLTVAYMTEGFSLGFDWCYEGLTDTQRQTIANIAIEKCLGFARDEYENIKRGSHTWSVTYTNHNTIPTSSFIIGAIAFAEYNPQLCQMILDYSSERIKNFLAGLFPDGGWWEGAMYTNLLYSHLAKASETLRLNFGADNVIANGSFIENAPDFFIGVTGPSGSYNFAEQRAPQSDAIPEMLWLANITNRGDVRSWALERINFGSVSNCILGLVWADNPDDVSEYTFSNNYTRGIEQITLGSGNTADASWLSVLGGTNLGSHKHLDLGSFIYDYNGVRWATELGLDDYYKGYQAVTSDEKIFYRSRAEGHNTLEINPTSASGGQRMNDENGVAKGEVIKYNLRSDKPYAIYDLSTAYSDNASSVKRGFRLLEDNIGFIVRDEFTTTSDADTVYWYMHTDASIEISDDGKSAVLTQDEKSVKLCVLEENLSFSVADAITPEPIRSELLAISKANKLELNKQNWNGYKQGDTDTSNDKKKLKITHSGTSGGTITVVLTQISKAVPEDAALPLDMWN